MILLLLLKDISFLFGAVFVAELLPTAPLLLLNYYSSVAQSTLLLKTQKRGDLIERATAMCSLRLWPWNDQKSVCKPRVQLIYEIIKKKKAPGLNTESKQQKSTERKLPVVVRIQPHCVNSCLVSGDAEFVAGQGDYDSHLLIVTGRGWTPARKKAIISLSSTARCYYCQNFNRATKSILQGQIKKSLSKPQHTEECLVGY